MEYTTNLKEVGDYTHILYTNKVVGTNGVCNHFYGEGSHKVFFMCFLVRPCCRLMELKLGIHCSRPPSRRASAEGTGRAIAVASASVVAGVAGRAGQRSGLCT